MSTPAGLKTGLEGDTIHVELAGETGAGARAALARVEEIDDVRIEGRTLHARTRDGGAAVPSVLAALDAHGIRTTSVTIARPSLDEVYLRYAGHAFSEAGAARQSPHEADRHPAELTA